VLRDKKGIHALDLRQLKYFVGIVAAGSFGRAASKLHIAQPALSRHIKALEEELGVTLLNRTARGVHMTEAGIKLKDHANYLLKMVDNIYDEVRYLGGNPSGTVVVGLPPSLAYILTPGLILECRERYPMVSIRVIEALSVFLIEWLEVGKIDLAILTVNTDSHATELFELATEQMVLVGTPEQLLGAEATIPMQTLHNYNIVTTAGFMSVMQPWFNSAKYVPNFKMELDSIPILRELVRKGLHCTIAPYSMVHDEIMAGQLRAIPLSNPQVFRTIMLAMNSRRPVSITMNAVGDLISEQVKKIPSLLP
jgi:LysR family nitrogen assimilation transcriptional regulator